MNACRHHKTRFVRVVLLAVLLSVGLASCVSVPPSQAAPHTQLNSKDYASRLQAMWLGESIANWVGLITEGVKEGPIADGEDFYTDADWATNNGRDITDWVETDTNCFSNNGTRVGPTIDFTFPSCWPSDDDTDIEYVYLHLMDYYQTTNLTPEQIVDGWQTHINRYIWVANARARELMDQRRAPPQTGQCAYNSECLMIDAQLTTELFGAVAPGIPRKALEIADLPIRTTADSFAADAARFFVVLYSLAPVVDPNLSPRDQVIWLVKEARTYIPNTSKTADITDVVLNDFLRNPDVNNWERTRDLVYDRYHENATANGFEYLEWYESSVNFATGLIALLYGQGDFKRTVQIGTLSGWDSDNGTATMGGLLGLILGYDRLVAQFPGVSLSDRYNINRTRDDLPDYLPNDRLAEDTFTLMAQRMLPRVEQAIIAAGGTVSGDTWTLPSAYNPRKLYLPIIVKEK